MAKRGSPQWFGEEAEARCANAYGAVVDPASGAAIITKGDSKQRLGTRRHLRDQLFESKHRGSVEKPARGIRLDLDWLEKLADAAWAENREPVLHLSIYAPNSPLSDWQSGCVDLTVRLLKDDVSREARLD